MEGPLWPKQSWKDLYLSKVTIYHERKLRAKATTNFKLFFLNMQTIGLSGRSHPALHNLLTTQVVKIARPHLKMLSGDYMCYYFLWKDRGSDPQCRLCPSSQYLPDHNCCIQAKPCQFPTFRKSSKPFLEYCHNPTQHQPNNNLT